MIVTTRTLMQRYHRYANPIDKIKRDADRGILLRLNRGLYETDRSVNPYLLASSILSPSYLSYEWALSYYGLIPERVTVITSASLGLGKRKMFINIFGHYEYSDIPIEAFSEGLTYIGEGDNMVKIASKEKALCDSLSKWRVVYSVSALKELLFDDKRIDIEEFESCDFALLYRLSGLYKKTNLKLLRQLIEKEYAYE